MNSQHDPGSHLFLVRFWSGGAQELTNEQEPKEGKDAHGHKGRIGRVQHVVSGEAHTFQGCPELIEVLLAMLSAENRGESDRASPVEMGET